MNITFLILACLLGWTSASPLAYSEDAALERRLVENPVKGGKSQSEEADSSRSNSNSGTNAGTSTDPTFETSSSVEIVNQVREFLERASELVNDDGMKKQCKNPSPGSAAEEACKACNDVTVCNNLAEQNRKKCVCESAAILQADAEKCNKLIATKNGELIPVSLKEACGTAPWES